MLKKPIHILNLLILSLCFFSLSCSFLLGKLGETPENYEVISPLERVYCGPREGTTMLELASSNNSANLGFDQFMNLDAVKNQKFTFIEKAVLWALIQMNIRPEASSPTSRLQVLISNKELETKSPTYAYWDFKAPIIDGLTTHKDSVPHYPYLDGLNFLLKHYHAKHDLYFLGKFLDMTFAGQLKADENFVSFLASQKKSLIEIPFILENLFRGDEPLREGEVIPKLSFEGMLKKFEISTKGQRNKESYYKQSQHLFTYRKKTELPYEAKCNYDMGLYENSVFLVNKEIFPNNVFGIQDGDNGLFLAVSAQSLDGNKNIKNTFFMQGQSNVRTAALCFLIWPDKNKKENASSLVSLISTDERDPGQHLFHIMIDTQFTQPTLEELSKKIQAPRYLFLSNPVRLIIESRRSSKDQLNQLMSLQIPMYHSLALGKVWGGLITNSKSDHDGFVLDDRRKGYLKCP